MTIEKSDEELLNSSAPWDLTEDELERKCELEAHSGWCLGAIPS
jgi:hypothetical protein